MVLFAACAPSAPVAPTPVRPETLRYAPYGAQYELSIRGSQTQTLPTGPATLEYAARVHLAARLEAADTGMTVTISIDSVTSVSGTGGVFAGGPALAGTVLRGSIRPDSGLRFDGTATETFARTVRNALRGAFPRFPVSGARTGGTWSVAAREADSVSGFLMQSESVSAYEAATWVDAGTTSTIEVSSTTRYDVRGQGQQLGQEVELEGAGTRTTRSVLSADGMVIASVATDSAATTASILAMGITIPIVQTRIDSLTLVPR